MYEQASHSLLNDILVELKPEIGNLRLRHFYTRLGANFYAIHSLFHLLYGDRPDFKEQMVSLVETLALRYIERHPPSAEIRPGARKGLQLVPEPEVGRHGALLRPFRR